jgi:biofilm PGA synthesis N-glycosyltransferase PgaC
MAPPQTVANYIVVTPVKNEEKYIARTLQSMSIQTVRPVRWVLVDDGSTDETPGLIHEFVGAFDWISCIRVERGAERQLGSAEVKAFEVGYKSVQHLDHEFVVKLDADLSLSSDYFEQMLLRFHANPSLGIASGLYLEEHDGKWRPAHLPSYHAAGAAKMLRLPCYQAIGGFQSLPGWDTVDEVRAWMNGWETTHFPEIQFHHLKAEGSASGTLCTSYFHGQIYYVCGGSALFFCGKVLHRTLTGKPFFLGGIMLLAGYMQSMLIRRPKIVTLQEEEFYTRLLNRRIFHNIVPKLSLRIYTKKQANN